MFGSEVTRLPDFHSGHSRDFRNLHSWFLILVLSLAPLPLGSIHPWSLSIFAILVILQLVILVPSILRDQRVWLLPKSLWLAAILVMGVLIWIYVQRQIGLMPEWQAKIWHTATKYGLDTMPMVAISATGGEFETLRLMTVLGVFLIAFTLGQSRRQANFILTALFWIIVAYGLIGLVQLGTGYRLSERLPDAERLTSTFVNRNHAATFLNIGFLIGLAKLIEPTFKDSSTNVRERWSTLIVRVIRSLFEERPWLTFTVAFLFVCSIATASRGGFLSLALAALFVLIIGLRHIFLVHGRGWAILFGIMAAFGAILWLGGEGLIARLDDIGSQLDVTTAGRIAVYTLTIELIAERPLTGYGYGLFDQLFALHRDERFFLFFDHAHNDWLELAAEIGLPAALAFWLACGIVFLVCLRGVFARRRGQLPALVASGTLILVGLHALVDFSLAMPSIMALVAVVTALGCAQARRKSETMVHDE